jgi:AcrR family transcriptional regulator
MATAKGARSRDAIRTAAAELFASRGYANTPVRDIAARAQVDPALVIRHFGSKEQLFIETMRFSEDDVLNLDGPIESLGQRIVEYVFSADDRIRTTFLALVRASDTGDVAVAMRVLHEEGFVAPLLRHLEGDTGQTRARLAAAMVGGLMYSLWIAQDATLLAMTPEQIVGAYAPALQVLIDQEPSAGAGAATSA